jgi:glycosyltransferase involved in cell wall biosynthesis
VESFSPAKMADAIAELIQNPDRRKKLGAAAVVRFKENFVVDVVAPKLLAELQNLEARSG